MSENKPLFGMGELNTAYAQYFIGKSYLNPLVPPEEEIPYMTANVTFEPGTRNNWHIHRSGYQILLITDGEGWYQEEGKKAQSLKAGDVIVTRDGIKHWHGAKKDSWMSHIAITAGEAEWLEAVDDKAYKDL
ncbi:cupin domain-containing protein [Lactococcus garvieae]|uniref:cupin domain-containing protein n=1 Tax=Lactococcus garvieae TaxID=1363 RepID=UPI0018D9FE22|nr:cupin domain-containing protein [Lactococcus garvieae]QPS70387.1 cupin domain-containing protein [Lactococcus garvieae]